MQVGVAGWGPLDAERSVVEPREGKMMGASRRAVEASKQCGRAWSMRVEEGGDLKMALEAGSVGMRVVMADASARWIYADGCTADPGCWWVPEGGWAEDEVRMAREAGAVVARVLAARDAGGDGCCWGGGGGGARGGVAWVGGVSVVVCKRESAGLSSGMPGGPLGGMPWASNTN